MKKLDIDTKDFFSQLDEDTIKKAKKKDKKDKKKKKDKESMLGDSKISKKVLKGIKSNELREQFKKQKVLIDNKKFWNKD